MLLITSIIASVLTIIFIRLSFAVIGLRRKNKVGLGSGVMMIWRELFALKVTLLSMFRLALS